MVTASAPGKIILLGEHAVVYGVPVLVASVDLRTYVRVEPKDDKFVLTNEPLGIKDFEFDYSDMGRLKKERRYAITIDCIERLEKLFGEKRYLGIEVRSDIPVSSGLGSSASYASALVLAVSKFYGKELSKKEIAKLAWDVENIVHGKSSGADPFGVTYGGVIKYRKGKLKQVKLKKFPEITIGNTGIEGDTGKAVMDVAKLKERNPKFFETYLKATERIVEDGQKALENGDISKLGELMNITHGLLSAISVSSPELDKLVWAARKKSPGAKLCGGGRGGIMMALGDVSKEIEKAGGSVIRTEISNDGVRIES